MAERASQKQSIESQLAERQRMLAGIQTEIKQLQAEEALRQARLAAEARARLAAATAGGRRRRRRTRVELADRGLLRGRLDTGSSDSLIPAAPPSQYGGVVGIAMQ